MLKKVLKYYLIVCGLVLHIGALTGVFYALNHFALTPRQFLVKLVEKSGFDSPVLVTLIEPEAQHVDHSFDGQIKSQHPRILLPEIAGLSTADRVTFFQLRNNFYKTSAIDAPPLPCNQTQLSALTSCWVTTGNEQKFDLAVEQLLNFEIETPDVTALYGNGWLLAFNYDLLATSPRFSKKQNELIQNKLETAIIEYLRVLDEDSASLWHGRMSLSSNAWLCAVLLDANTDKRKELVTRAQGHFLASVQSAAITEAWPEGYNYWINNRAFYFTLAASAYINGLENSQHAGQIKQLLERIGLWHIYATRPDNKAEGYGDEGPRIDLKDETRRVIDIIASTTGNQNLADYSLYLQKLHGIESYYRGYRWGFHLFNNPKLLSATATGSLNDFEGRLPKVELFGRNGSNALYLRSGWGPNASYLTYRAGHNFTHHGHYDAGHFTLFKGQPLAMNGSNYGDYTGANRLNYSLRTIAKNSLLIQRPGEKVKPNRFFTDNVAAGGQRITLPTGSAIRSPEHWQDNLYQDQHLAGAELEQFSHNSDYTFIESDLTPAYNNTQHDENGDGGKVQKITRALMYLNKQDLLLVHDQIQATNPDYRAKWLLHSANKPQVTDEKVLKGDAENGILVSTSREALIERNGSTLKVNTLFPSNTKMHLIGGNSYRYYVEVDGDDATLDGINMSMGASNATWFENPAWRTEIFSPENTAQTHFLIALSPSSNGIQRTSVVPLSTSDEEQYGALFDDTAVIFTRTRGQFDFNLPARVRRVYLVGTLQRPQSIWLNGLPVSIVQQNDNITRIQLPASLENKSLRIAL